MVTSTYCLNPDCKNNPPNSSQANFCEKCGSKLLLNNRYLAIKNLGGGGFGTAFLAQDISSNNFCVIKVLHCLIPKAKELFEREANQLKQLGNYPQIPQFLDYFEASLKPAKQNQLNGASSAKYFFLIQEYIEGQSLSEIVKNNTLNEQKIREFLLDILPTIKFIHERDIIHRDIKPDNIIQRHQDRKFVLIDFGGVKEFTYTNIGQTGTEIYTPGYAANEHIRGKAIPASDLYSIGGVCLYLLTGVEPREMYDNYNDCLLWRETLNKKRIRITEHFDKILEKLLEPLARNRYQSADEVLLELLPDIKINQANLKINIQQLGEKVSQEIRITNSIPYSLLSGTLLLDNDRNWLSIMPKSFKGNDIKCLIEIDSVYLSGNSSYKEQILLVNNSRTKNVYIEIEVSTPGVKFSQTNLILRANKLDEILSETVTIFQVVPNAVLQGIWHIYPDNLKHDWISIIPQQFKQSAGFKIIVDTSQLKSDTKFKRQIELQSNLLSEKYRINLEVQTAPPVFKRISYLALLAIFIIAGVGTFSILMYSMYLAKDSGWVLSSLTDELKIFEWITIGFEKQFIWLFFIILSGWTAFPRVFFLSLINDKSDQSLLKNNGFVPGILLFSFAAIVAIVGIFIHHKLELSQVIYSVFSLILIASQAILMTIFSGFGTLIVLLPRPGIDYLKSQLKKLKFEFHNLNLSQFNVWLGRILKLITFLAMLTYFLVITIFVSVFIVFAICFSIVIYIIFFQAIIMPFFLYLVGFVGVNRITGLDFLVMGIIPLLIELGVGSVAIARKAKLIKKINYSILPILLFSLIIFGVTIGIFGTEIARMYFPMSLISLKIIIKTYLVAPLILVASLSGTASIVLLFYLAFWQKRLLQYQRNIESGKIEV